MIRWIDTLQQGIADKLASDLPAMLLTLEDAYGDGVALDPPAEIWPCDKAQINSTPAIEVWCPDGNRQNPDDTSIDYGFRLTIVWTIAGTDEVEIDRRIKRYLLATVKVLDGAVIVGFENSPIVCGTLTFLVVDGGNDEQPFSRTAAVEISTQMFASEV